MAPDYVVFYYWQELCSMLNSIHMSYIHKISIFEQLKRSETWKSLYRHFKDKSLKTFQSKHL